MQFKRWRLVPRKAVVNAGLGAFVLALGACGGTGGENAPDTPPLELPAAWSTKPLDGPIADIALAGGAASLLAVAYEDRGLAFFDLQSNPVSDPVGFKIAALGDGVMTRVDGAEITLFPGINDTGALKGYIHGSGLLSPVEVDLPINAGAPVGGLCSAPASGAGRAGQSGEAGNEVLDIGYWTHGEDVSFVRGVLSVEDGDFAWREIDSPNVSPAISACLINGAKTDTLADGSPALAQLVRPNATNRVALTQDGGLRVAQADGPLAPARLRAGITVEVPKRLVALSALGEPRDGGYPAGVIVVAGETGPGEHRVIFVDGEPLYRPAE